MDIRSKLISKSLSMVVKEKPWVENVVADLLDKLFAAESMDEVCQAFVSTDGYDTKAIGALFCAVSETGQISFDGSFGQELDSLKVIASKLHSDNSLYSLTTPFIPALDQEKFFCVCIPAMDKKLSIGVLFVAGQSIGDSKFEINGNFIDTLLTKSLGLLVRKIRKQNRVEFHHGETGKEIFSLSPRQIDILKYISAGLTNEQIAKTLIVSPSTVRHETIKIYSYLEVPSRKLAIEAAKSRGLI